MKGIVVDINSREAVILADNGIFKKVKNADYEIGQTIQLREIRRTSPGILRGAVSMAAMLTIGVIGAFAYYTPTDYVSLDVNPSVEYQVNMFERILDVNAVNEDGEEILSGLDLSNKNIEEALKVTLDQLIADGYLADDPDSGVVIATSNDKMIKAEKLAVELEKEVQAYLDSREDVTAEVAAAAVVPEKVQEAKQLGVTPGKLTLVEKLEASTSGAINKEDWLSMPVKDINKEIKKNWEMTGGKPDEAARMTYSPDWNWGRNQNNNQKGNWDLNQNNNQKGNWDWNQNQDRTQREQDQGSEWDSYWTPGGTGAGAGNFFNWNWDQNNNQEGNWNRNQNQDKKGNWNWDQNQNQKGNWDLESNKSQKKNSDQEKDQSKSQEKDQSKDQDKKQGQGQVQKQDKNKNQENDQSRGLDKSQSLNWNWGSGSDTKNSRDGNNNQDKNQDQNWNWNNNQNRNQDQNQNWAVSVSTGAGVNNSWGSRTNQETGYSWTGFGNNSWSKSGDEKWYNVEKKSDRDRKSEDEETDNKKRDRR